MIYLEFQTHYTQKVTYIFFFHQDVNQTTFFKQRKDWTFLDWLLCERKLLVENLIYAKISDLIRKSNSFPIKYAIPFFHQGQTRKLLIGSELSDWQFFDLVPFIWTMVGRWFQKCFLILINLDNKIDY